MGRIWTICMNELSRFAPMARANGMEEEFSAEQLVR